MTAALEAELRSACDAQRWEHAATLAIRGYGPELLGYAAAILRDPHQAEDVLASVCEQLWTALPRFAWQSTFRTWAYAITRNACISQLRGTRAKVLVTSAALEAVAQELRTQTASYLRTTTKDRLAQIRAALDPDDQTLLILRVDRQLPWRDIAQVFEGEAAGDEALAKRAAALRKRFERLKLELRDQLGR